MKVVHDPKDPLRKKPVGEMAPGTAVLNGEGNLCVITRGGLFVPPCSEPMVRVLNVENGGNYSVPHTCCYEVVEATVTWRRVPQ